MRPRQHPGRGVVAGVGHVHAAGGPGDQGTRAGHLGHVAHDEGALAALAGAVAGGVVLLHRQDGDPAVDLQVGHNQFRCGHQRAPPSVLSELVPASYRGSAPGPRTPIHWQVASCSPRAVTCSVTSSISCMFSAETSRPPRPAMNGTSTGRRGSGYRAAATSVYSTPASELDPKE